MATSNPLPAQRPAPWTHFRTVADSLARGDRAGALRSLRALVTEQPDLPSGWAALAAFLLASGRPNAAAIAALRGVRCDTDHVDSLTAAGCATLALGDLHSAMHYLDRAIARELHHPDSHLARMRATHMVTGAAAAVATAAHALACTTCAVLTIPSNQHAHICAALVRESPVLQPTDSEEAHDLLRAARAVVMERPIAALADLNAIRTDATRTPTFDAAARALSIAILRHRHR